MAHAYFKDFTKKTDSDKILRDKAFNIAKNPKYDGYQQELLQWSIDFLIKNILVEQLKIRIFQTKSQLNNYTNQLLKNSRKEKYTHLLKTIIGVLILLICN